MEDKKDTKQTENDVGVASQTTPEGVWPWAAWMRKCLGQQGFFFVVAITVGITAGICAAVLKLAIGAMARLMSHICTSGHYWWPLLIVPIIGIVLTGAYQRYIVHDDLRHGLRRIHDFLDKGGAYMRGRLMYAWMVAATLTLGFGGSAGSEGPIASTGAAWGSNIARKLGMDDYLTRVLIGCGAGAGIAGIFKAPIGGFIFTLEVMRMGLKTMTVMALLASCLMAAMTAYVLSGFTVDLSYIQPNQFEPHTILWIAGLGVICGLYSLYYSRIMKTMERFYDSIRRPLVRNVISGAILAVCLYAFPAMYGEGYSIMGEVLNGHHEAVMAGWLYKRWEGWMWAPVIIAAGIVLIKAFACSATNCGGGVAGDFAPTLFAGCMLGFVFAAVANGYFGADLPVGGFAFIGMAGVMAGVVRAPFMAIFLCAEMCNGFVLLLPLLCVAAISFGVVRIFRPADPYRTQ